MTQRSSPTIRPARSTDRVGPVVVSAFGEEGEHVAAIWRALVDGGLVRASLIVERDGEVLGHVGLSHAWLDARPALVDIWLLSPLSVLPSEQGHGVGSALVAAAVRAAESAGTPLVVLEGDPAYYGARGFAAGSERAIGPASERTPGPAFQVAALSSYRPWMRGRVIYPDVWWRADAVGLRDPLLAELEQRLGPGG